MKRLILPQLLALLIAVCRLQPIQATLPADTVFIRQNRIPLLIDREDNEFFHLRIEAQTAHTLNDILLEFGPEVNLEEIAAVKLYYGGTECHERKAERAFAPTNYLSSHNPRYTRAANPSYSILCSSMKHPERRVTLKAERPLFPGIHYFWISLQLHPQASLLSKVSASLSKVEMDGEETPLQVLQGGHTCYVGIGVRHAGDDGAAAYRIPGLTTSNKGTLLGVYDVRHNSSVDLQEHVNIGLSRSTDGGQSWEKMRIPLDFGEYNGLPKAQNGVGDPAILTDRQTGTLWIMAAWTHGMGNGRAWNNSRPGQQPGETAQLVLTRSDDDGQSWSAPINITSQVKQPDWHFLLQGPGRGISMTDGTLVFAGQYINADRMPSACLIYSKDHGTSWHISQPARSNTTEAQVAEIEPGVLMLNMRDNRGGSRAVATTRDLGQTWQEHPSSRKALTEPVCMASLLHVPAAENTLGKDLLLFSNPDSPKHRHRITLKASLDGGLTWLPEHQLMLDEGTGWGYSCLSMIDRETVGILYESSTAHILFQAIRLTDLVP